MLVMLRIAPSQRTPRTQCTLVLTHARSETCVHKHNLASCLSFDMAHILHNSQTHGCPIVRAGTQIHWAQLVYLPQAHFAKAALESCMACIYLVYLACDPVHPVHRNNMLCAPSCSGRYLIPSQPSWSKKPVQLLFSSVLATGQTAIGSAQPIRLFLSLFACSSPDHVSQKHPDPTKKKKVHRLARLFVQVLDLFSPLTFPDSKKRTVPW